MATYGFARAEWLGAGHELPVAEVRGAEDGPSLTLLAGVHGCEYTPMAALREFMAGVDERVVRGRIRAVLMVDVAAFRARSPFVSPVDGKNLNRCFPGEPRGTYSERLADLVFERFVLDSDAVVDVHAGDLTEDLSPFTLCDSSPVVERAWDLAEAYGAPICVTQPADERTVGGSTSAAAADAGIPAFIAEAGGCGVVTPRAVGTHVLGLRRVAVRLGVLPADPSVPAPPRVRHMTTFRWLRAGATGWWEPAVEPGQEVVAGQHVGRILDPHGREVEVVLAPETGVCVFVTVSPPVGPGSLLLAVAGAERR